MLGKCQHKDRGTNDASKVSPTFQQALDLDQFGGIIELSEIFRFLSEVFS